MALRPRAPTTPIARAFEGALEAALAVVVGVVLGYYCDRWLGTEQATNLLLHGHAHDGVVHRLPSGLLELSTGSGAVEAAARPAEVPNQYQVLSSLISLYNLMGNTS